MGTSDERPSQAVPAAIRLDAALAKLRQAAQWVVGAMFAAVFVIFNYKIFTRYFEHNEAIWADEILVILFVWIIFWAQAFIVRDKEQIAFDLVYRLLPLRARRIAALAQRLLVGGVFLWSLPASLGYIGFLWREHTPVLNLPLDVVYSCSGIFLIAVIIRAGASFMRLSGPRWRDEI